MTEKPGVPKHEADAKVSHVAPRQGGQRIPTAVLLFLPSLIWSTVFPFSKLVLASVTPTRLAALRFSVGAVFLTLYAVYQVGWPAFLEAFKRNRFRFVVLGLFGIFLNNWLQNLGLNLTSAGSTSLLGSADPIFATLLAALFLGEKLNGRKILGLAVAFLGIFMVTTGGTWRLDFGDSGIGNLLVLAAAVSYSTYTVLSKDTLHREAAAVVVAWATILGAMMLCVTALFSEPAIPWNELGLPTLFNIAYLSVVPTSVSVVAYAYLLQRIQASLAAISLFLIPVFSLGWSVLVLKESIGWAMLAGGVLIIGGVALAIAGRER